MYKAFENWKVVLLSILGATTFWFFNALNKDYSTRIIYPVEFQFNQDSVVVVEPLAKDLIIDVSSGGWNLLRKTFWFNVEPVTIPLDNPTEIGFYTRASLSPIIEDQLGELTINYLVTDTVYIHIEPKISRKVKLTIDSLSIPLEENHRLVSPISISPDSILITGPQSFIDTLGYTYPVKINVNGISNNFDRSLDINLPTSLSYSNPNEIQVAFNVERFDRMSIEVQIETANFPEDSSAYLETSTVQVFYTIAESKQEDFVPHDFAVTADYRMMDPDDSTVVGILVYYPEETLDQEVIPEYIKVIYE